MKIPKIENKKMVKKEVVVLIRELHKRFMKMDFILYTEEPKEPTEFYFNKILKEKYKKIIFKYENKVQVVHNLTKYEYQVWRANFPIQAVTTKGGKDETPPK